MNTVSTVGHSDDREWVCRPMDSYIDTMGDYFHPQYILSLFSLPKPSRDFRGLSNLYSVVTSNTTDDRSNRN